MLCLDHDIGARVLVQVRGVISEGNFAMLARKSLIGKWYGPDHHRDTHDEVAITTDIDNHVHRHPHRVEVIGGTARMREGAHENGR